MSGVILRYAAGTGPRHLERPSEVPPNVVAAWQEAAAFVYGTLEVRVGALRAFGSAASFLFGDFAAFLSGLERWRIGREPLDLHVQVVTSGDSSYGELLVYEHEGAVQFILRQMDPTRQASHVALSPGDALAVLCPFLAESSAILLDSLRGAFVADADKYCQPLVARVAAVCA